jgi:PAS domain S-box-containing protein
MKRFQWNNQSWVLSIDIDQTKELEMLLKAELEEKRFRAMFNVSAIPTTVYDVDKQEIKEINAASLRQYGYLEEDLRDFKVTKLWPEELQSEITNMLLLTKNSPTSNYFRTKHITKTGEILDVDIFSHPLPFELYGCNTR